MIGSATLVIQKKKKSFLFFLTSVWNKKTQGGAHTTGLNDTQQLRWYGGAPTTSSYVGVAAAAVMRGVAFAFCGRDTPLSFSSRLALVA